MVRKSIKLLIILLILKINSNDYLEKYQSNIFLTKEEVIYEENNDSKKFTDENNSNTKEEYIAILEIPSISFKKRIFSKESDLNIVNNIKVLKESTFPNFKGGNFILAGHSGSGEYAHFNDLHKLKIKDLINLYYNNKKYIFEIINIYEIKKTGQAIIKDNYNTNLTLITCKGINKQLIIIADLKSD